MCRSTKRPQRLRDKAARLLTSGFEGVRTRGEASTSAAIGSLYLVQLLLTRGDWQEALNVLEDKKVGPLTLVSEQNDATSQPEFVLETYKAALRAYLSAQPPKRDEAQAMMVKLDKFVADAGGAAAEQLTRIYVGLGLQLQRQIKELTAAGQGVQAQQVAAAFGDVLDHVAQRPDAGDWAIRNWIAQTNLQIGEGLKGADAKRYLDRARAAYEAVLEAAKTGGAGRPTRRRCWGCTSGWAIAWSRWVNIRRASTSTRSSCATMRPCSTCSRRRPPRFRLGGRNRSWRWR